MPQFCGEAEPLPKFGKGFATITRMRAKHAVWWRENLGKSMMCGFEKLMGHIAILRI